LRNHLTEGIERHSEETLKRSVKDDAGDLSSYGQHMADAGTDTFDRDFALSLVSNEQEALSEIEAAIKRILDGTYGICEITAKPISKERLLAVPFTRYSAEAQKQIERNRHHSRTQAGLFGEGEEGGAIPHEDGADESDPVAGPRAVARLAAAQVQAPPRSSRPLVLAADQASKAWIAATPPVQHLRRAERGHPGHPRVLLHCARGQHRGGLEHVLRAERDPGRPRRGDARRDFLGRKALGSRRPTLRRSASASCAGASRAT
jgi:RNA polymerase-binding transcription factor DksA